MPFLLAAVAIRPFMAFMQRFQRHLGRVEKVMGALLVITGIMFLTGTMNWMGQWLLDNVPIHSRRIEEMIHLNRCRTRSGKRALAN